MCSSALLVYYIIQSYNDTCLASARAHTHTHIHARTRTHITNSKHMENAPITAVEHCIMCSKTEQT